MSKQSQRWAEDVVVEHPGRIAPRLAAFIQRWVAPVVRVVHRPTLSGVENLPSDRPFLLVGNHPAGIGAGPFSCFVTLYLDKVGRQRRLAGFVLPVDFHVPGLNALVRGLGAIPSSYDHARQALKQGVPILVLPGSDHEGLTPVWRADRVDFNGRLGFLRIARDARVPIVPLGFAGHQFVSPILWRSRALASLLVVPRIIGVRRWGLSLLGLLGAIAIVTLAPVSVAMRALLVWLWLGSPLVFASWIPWRVRMRIGAPIEPSALFAGGADNGDDGGDNELRAALARVERAVQEQVDAA